MTTKQKAKKAGEKAKENDVWALIIDDIEDGMTEKDLSKKYASLYGRCSNGFKNLIVLHKPAFKYSLITRYGGILPFQQEIINRAISTPKERTVFWLYDISGLHGKSKCAKHLTANYGFKKIGNADTQHIACAWNGEHVVFDIPRHKDKKSTEFNYEALESLLDTSIFSTKYMSGTKEYEHDIHVFVFCNFLPDTTALTKDKWDIHTLNNGIITKITVDDAILLQNNEKFKEEERKKTEQLEWIKIKNKK